MKSYTVTTLCQLLINDSTNQQTKEKLKLGWDELNMYLKLALSATSSLPRLASINLIVVEVSPTLSSFIDEGKVRLSK